MLWSCLVVSYIPTANDQTTDCSVANKNLALNSIMELNLGPC